MQITTEEEIINILSKNIPMTIIEISTQLNLTKADIRYQLKKLQKKGVITQIEAEFSHRGRPAARFKLSDNFFKNNFLFLFDAIFHLLPPGLDHYSNLAKYIAEKIETDNKETTVTKINNLVSNLNSQNYDARWETQYHGPVIFFANCPYRLLIKKYPGLCAMDKEIIENVLNMKVNTFHTIAEFGRVSCKFQVMIE